MVSHMDAEDGRDTWLPRDAGPRGADLLPRWDVGCSKTLPAASWSCALTPAGTEAVNLRYVPQRPRARGPEPYHSSKKLTKHLEILVWKREDGRSQSCRPHDGKGGGALAPNVPKGPGPLSGRAFSACPIPGGSWPDTCAQEQGGRPLGAWGCPGQFGLAPTRNHPEGLPGLGARAVPQPEAAQAGSRGPSLGETGHLFLSAAPMSPQVSRHAPGGTDRPWGRLESPASGPHVLTPAFHPHEGSPL